MEKYGCIIYGIYVNTLYVMINKSQIASKRNRKTMNDDFFSSVWNMKAYIFTVIAIILHVRKDHFKRMHKDCACISRKTFGKNFILLSP